MVKRGCLLFGLIAIFVFASNVYGKTVLVQTETGSVVAPMAVASDADAGAGQYIYTSLANAGILNWTVNIVDAGDYIVWGRVFSPSSSRDSFFVSVDGGAEEIWDTAEQTWSSQWQWTRVTKRNNGTPVALNATPRIFNLSAGTHQFTFRGRDANTFLDQLIITQDTSFVPQGKDPVLPLPPNPTLPVTGFFVSPQGSAQGDGSMQNPWDLQTALCSGRAYTMAGNGWPQCSRNGTAKVLPGDTIWLRGGTYGKGGATLFQSRLQGTADKPIIVKQYPGERATINGGISEALLSEPIENYARHVWYWGFEITNTSLQRVVPLNNNDTQIVGGRPGGLELFGEGAKAINLIIHDVGHPCIGFWQNVGNGGEINGVIMWGCGFDDTGTVYTLAGSGIYAQNTEGTRLIKDVISFREFTTGFKIYGGATNGFRVEGNVLFNNHQLNLEVIPNGGHNTERLVVTNNYTYRPRQDGRTGVEIGRRAVLPGPEYLYDEGVDAVVTNNYFVVGDFDPWPDPHGEYPGPGLWFDDFSNVTVTNNTFVGGNLAQWAKLPNTTGNWNNNAYFPIRAVNDPDRPFFYLAPPRSTSSPSQHYFNEWKNICNCDQNSTLTNGYPTQNLVVVRPNQYEQGRANIIVYNWQNLASVNVDLTNSGLRVGETFEVRDAQNFFGPPVYTGRYVGGAISLPTNLTTVVPYIGDLNPFEPYQLAHTPAEFNAYVLIKTDTARVVYGDVSDDGNVNIYDASLVAQYAIGIPVVNFNVDVADVSGDGNINLYDASLIAQYAVGLITKLPME